MRDGCGRRLAIHKGHTVDEIAYVVAQPDRIEGDLDVAPFGVGLSDDSVDPVSPCVHLCQHRLDAADEDGHRRLDRTALQQLLKDAAVDRSHRRTLLSECGIWEQSALWHS